MTLSFVLPSNSIDYNSVSASVWIRGLQLIPYLQRLGIECQINQYSEKTGWALFVRTYDEQDYLNAVELKKKGVKILLDLCVNYVDAFELKGQTYGPTKAMRDKILKMLEVADLTICASQFICDRIQNLGKRAVYIPDSVNFEHFSFKKDPQDFYKKKLNLAYSGVAVKSEYLFKNIYPQLDFSKFELTVIADRRPFWFKRYQFKKWNFNSFPTDILKSEICLAPREVNDPYNQGHSFFKVGVFMAQGVPAMASPVPSYFELAQSGKFPGLLSDKDSVWMDQLKLWFENRDELVRISQEAQDAMRPFSTQNIASQYAQVLKGM